MDTLIINFHSREKRAALLRNQKVDKIYIDRPEHRSLVGNIYYGTVTKVLPGMNAVFIDIGEEKNAYLHRNALASYVLSDAEKQRLNVSSFVHQGEKLLVQVEKDAAGTKGPRVTGIIELQGDNLVYLPNGHYIAVSKKIADEQKNALLRKLGQRLKTEEEGLIFRTSSLYSAEDALRAELTELRGEYEGLVQAASALKKPGLVSQKDALFDEVLKLAAGMRSGEIITDDLLLKKRLAESGQIDLHSVTISLYTGKENVFAAHRVEHEIEKALKRVVWLENGAYLIFDETEALTIIDVNTGKFSGKTDYQDTVLKTNTLAARETARQIRLRDIGGMVLIDFIDMKTDKDRESVLRAMEQELEKDEKRTKLIGFTPLGILQLTRKKTRSSLSEVMQEKCPVCHGTGRILSAETVAFRLERELLEHRFEADAILIETTKAVKEAFLGLNETCRSALEEWTGMKLFFSITSSPEHYYVLKQFGESGELSQKEQDDD